MSPTANPAPTDNGAPAKPAGNPVIRRTTFGEEDAHQRLMKKQVPAWVISGAIHEGLCTPLVT